MIIHVYRSGHQPATRFRVEVGRKTHTFSRRRRAIVRTDCCKQKRWAGNCTIQVYYDAAYHWCRDGKGCKHGR
jgi:hypothetical protein